MAVTLAQLARQSTEDLKKGIIMNILRDAPVMEVLPFVPVGSLSNISIRWQTLPSVAFRALNEGYTASEGTTEQVWESVYGFGGDIEIDRVMDKVTNVVQPVRMTQVQMKTKAMALTFNDFFINGDHATNIKAFEGLQKRVTGMPSRQSVYFAGAAAAALDPTASVANGRAFFNKLEEIHYKTNKGAASRLFLNEAMYYGVGAVARYIQASGGNYLTTQKDAFDREITMFKGTPMLDVGLKTDQSTEIITDSETAGDAGTDATSIYGVSFDETDGLVGIELSPMEVYDPLDGGERESKPTKLIRVEWWMGLSNPGSHGVVRGRNVEGATNWT